MVSPSHLVDEDLHIDIVLQWRFGFDCDVLQVLDFVPILVVLVLELHPTAVEIESCLALDDALVVEESGEGVDQGLCDFGGGFVGEVEFDFGLAAVWFLEQHIINGVIIK